MSSHYWIKLYHEILSDPKMGRLSNRTWRRAIELFLLAGKDGALPPLADIAWLLRIPELELSQDLQVLQKIGIMDGERWRVADWLRCQRPVSIYREMRYADYLKTYHWQARRARALKLSGNKCEMCGAEELDIVLHVHHLNYERLGYERDEDLQVLCWRCHKAVHEAMKGDG